MRGNVAESLGYIPDHRAVEPLIKTLADPLPGVRQVVIRTLAAIGNPQAVDAIRSAWYDQDESVAAVARESLEQISLATG